MATNGKGVSLNELARRLGRSQGGIQKLAATGQIPRLADKTFDQVAVERALRKNLDPAKAKRPSGARLFDLATIPDPVARARLEGAITMARWSAEVAALSAVDAGASVASAFALAALMLREADLKLVEIGQELGAFGKVKRPNLIDISAMPPIQWHWLAADAGEAVDLPAWEAWRDQVLSLWQEGR